MQADRSSPPPNLRPCRTATSRPPSWPSCTCGASTTRTRSWTPTHRVRRRGAGGGRRGRRRDRPGRAAPPFAACHLDKDSNDTAGVRTTHGPANGRRGCPTATTRWSRAYALRFVILGKTNAGVRQEEHQRNTGYRRPETLGLSRTTAGHRAAPRPRWLPALPDLAGQRGGGSIRIRRRFCGVFGLKPTRGRVSNSPRRPTRSPSTGRSPARSPTPPRDDVLARPKSRRLVGPAAERPFAARSVAIPAGCASPDRRDPFVADTDGEPTTRLPPRGIAGLLESLGHSAPRPRRRGTGRLPRASPSCSRPSGGRRRRPRPNPATLRSTRSTSRRACSSPWARPLSHDVRRHPAGDARNVDRGARFPSRVRRPAHATVPVPALPVAPSTTRRHVRDRASCAAGCWPRSRRSPTSSARPPCRCAASWDATASPSHPLVAGLNREALLLLLRSPRNSKPPRPWRDAPPGLLTTSVH